MITIKHFKESEREYHLCSGVSVYKPGSPDFEFLKGCMENGYDHIRAMVEIRNQDRETYFIDVEYNDELYIHDENDDVQLNLEARNVKDCSQERAKELY